MSHSALRAEIEALFEGGLYVSAFRAAERAWGPPATWRGPEDCLLGSRILHHVGAPRGSAVLLIRAYRAAPLDPEVASLWAHYLGDRRGPYAGLEFLRTFPVDAAPAEAQVRLRHARAVLLLAVRDFEAAEYELTRAEVLGPGDARARMARAGLLAAQDQIEAAQDVLRDILREHPHHRGAVPASGRSLVELGRVEEAEALLVDADAKLEIPGLAGQLASLELSRRRPREAWRWLVRAAELSVAAEPGLVVALAAACSEAASEAGDYAAAINLARSVGSEWLVRLAERLEAGGERGRVMLEVPYVRQAHKTCAPATLTALCRYFGRPAEHLAIAEEICFDGTAGASERRWAEAQGLVAREFTVTWEAARQLLDGGLPFALCTQEVGSAHEQAIAGYDAALGSFSVRDPSHSRMLLFDVEALLRAQAWCGPRGLVLVPREQAARLDGVTLPDAELYDLHNAIEQALRRHEREAAAAALAELERRAPGHALTGHAARSLAAYDDNPAGVLAAIERLLQRYPDVAALKLSRLTCLAVLGRAAERREQLEALVAGGAHPLFSQLLADVLLEEPGAADRAEALARRLQAIAPGEPASYATLAVLRSRQGRWTEARALLRYAACLSPVESGAASAYVGACLHTGARAEAIAFLRDRFERLGRRFTAPALDLQRALDASDRAAEGLEVLARALVWRPDDGALLLAAAKAHAAVGQVEAARALHGRARDRVRVADWEVVAAELDTQEGALERARARYDELLRATPLALEVYRAVAPLDAALLGPEAARERLAAAAERFPHHAGLARLRVEWAPEEGEEGLAAVEALVRLAPDDILGRVQLALLYGRSGRRDEATAAVEAALRSDPNDPRPFLARAQLALWQGDRAGGAASLRTGLGLMIDTPQAIGMLVSLARTPEERRAALAFVRAELRRQVTGGPALAAYRAAAANVEPDAEVLALLEEARSVRPDLLASWTQVALQLAAMGRIAEARAIAGVAADQFPLQAEARLALASVLAAAGDGEGRIAALEEAVAIAPSEAQPTLILAEALTEAGQARRAIELLERALRGAPLEVAFADGLAVTRWNEGAREAAIDAVLAALRVEPAGRDRWDMLADWSQTAGATARVIAAVRELVAARPKSGWVRFGLARLLPDEAIGERLELLDEAIRVHPQLIEAHDARAQWLMEAQRWDEALAACNPPGFGEPKPLALRARAVHIRGVRGDRRGAIQAMKALIEEMPGYTFGWSCIARWASELGDLKLTAKAYAELLRILPERADLADTLLDTQLRAGDVAGAEATVAALRRIGDDDATRRGALRVALARGPEAALALYEHFACTPGVSEGALFSGLNVLEPHVTSGAMHRFFERLIARPDAAPAIGYLWGRVRASGLADVVFLPGRLRALRARGAIGIEATAGHVERLGLEGSRVALRLYVWRERAALRTSTRLWASVGYAYLLVGWFDLARAWFADWRERADAEPWMMRRVVEALRGAGADAEAREVGERALAGLKAGSHEATRHRLWFALDLARAGETAAAREALAELGRPDGDTFGLWLYLWARVLLARRDPAQTPADVAGLMAERERLEFTAVEKQLAFVLRPIYDGELERAGR